MRLKNANPPTPTAAPSPLASASKASAFLVEVSDWRNSTPMPKSETTKTAVMAVLIDGLSPDAALMKRNDMTAYAIKWFALSQP